MKIYTGTSGFGYKEWKGNFYPEKIASEKMLAYYSGRLTAVEINNTFYRMPSETLLEAWAGQVPDGFRFAIKAPQIITHVKGLRNAEEEVRRFLEALEGLEDKLGAVFFQLPGSFHEDRVLLKEFLSLLPSGTPCAFEFRDPAWLNRGTYDLLGEKGFAICNAETDKNPLNDIVSTAPWGYLRLRREDYPGAALSRWSGKIRAQKWKNAFVFFKHEGDEAAKGPHLALQLHELLTRPERSKPAAAAGRVRAGR